MKVAMIELTDEQRQQVEMLTGGVIDVRDFRTKQEYVMDPQGRLPPNQGAALR